MLHRLIAAVALTAVLLVYAWLLVPQLGKPFVYDDVNFILGAEAIARTGLPFGNQGYLLHLTHEREQWALWHPPLYLYVLGMAVAMFGSGEIASRSVAVVCQLFSAALAFDLARRTALEQKAGRGEDLIAGVLATAFLLLNPLTVQAALVLDIDNTILMLLVSVFVWLAVQRPGPWGGAAIAIFATLYTVTLWAKLTTPLILLVALAFTRFFQGTGMRGARDALLVGLVGWLAFLLSWLVATSISGMPFDYTFIVVYREAIESGASTRDRLVSWSAFVSGAAPGVLWIGPFFCALFVLAGLPRLWSLIRGRGLNPTDLAIVLGAAIYLAYIMKLAGNFPKYHAAMLSLWAAACGALVARCAARPSSWQMIVLGAGTLASLGWLASRMGTLWQIELTPELTRLLIVVPSIVGLAVAALWAQIGRVHIAVAVPVTLAGLTFAWALALDVHQRGLTGSTAYYYGRHGQIEAARALSELLSPDELYIASKEVAWYASQRRYVDQESWQHHVWDLGEGFDGTWLGQDIRLMALEVGEPTARWGYERVLSPRYRVVGEYGNFLVLERI